MKTVKRVTTKAQALRAFRRLLAEWDLGSGDYIDVLQTIGELAKDLADDELIVQRIYTLQGVSEARRDQ